MTLSGGVAVRQTMAGAEGFEPSHGRNLGITPGEAEI